MKLFIVIEEKFLMWLKILYYIVIVNDRISVLIVLLY